jgi:stage II sporulation protein AA (anti-sigma F factor antagonist)
MQIKVESYGHAVILICKGEMTVDALESLGHEVDRQLPESVTDLVFNLAEVTFVDSAGLEYLLDLQDRLAERLGQVTLTNLDENVTKIFEMTRLRGSFQVCKDVSEAVKAIQ